LRAAEEDAGKEHAVRLRRGWDDVRAVKRLHGKKDCDRRSNPAAADNGRSHPADNGCYGCNGRSLTTAVTADLTRRITAVTADLTRRKMAVTAEADHTQQMTAVWRTAL
jgi:hypothetical protein